ncbi:LuxR C-terminal-related transcriptional regulator [Streptacidiphilus sp. N1-10]|uniref:LuxR C-terminal-related transcriptional regulator n=2 Tax=Streptacidiphilus TaxID=228398 RepID=A0ABV6XXW4_9ACTN
MTATSLPPVHGTFAVHPKGELRTIARPALFERLGGAGLLTIVVAPAGSGKTVLLRSWVEAAGLADRTAWVSVEREDHDPQRFWLTVLDEIRGTVPGSGLVRALTPAPDLDGFEIVERLAEDLEALDGPVYLVIDDLHEVRSEETLRQLALLLKRSTGALRLILASRHDLSLGLHRLRLEDQVTEIRADDLRFTPGEARALLDAAGIQLSQPAVDLLHERAEGWAAGLRLAALLLSRHSEPERFAIEFSGGERTVAEYLLAEVLGRQSADGRRLLLRTSILERIDGPLADALTGDVGSERILQDLEDSGAFTVSLDPARSSFRYHHLFADLLRLELRRTEPDELPVLHRTAAEWYVKHDRPVEAIRHAQAGGEWALASTLLADHWFALELDGQASTGHELLAEFPADATLGDPQLAAVAAADYLNRGAADRAEELLAIADGGSASLSDDRRHALQAMLAILRLNLARLRGNLPAVFESAERLLAPETPLLPGVPLRADMRALGLVSLGIAESWLMRVDEPERYLAQGISLARQLERPYLEFNGLAHAALVAHLWSLELVPERSHRALRLAEQHGWSQKPIIAIPCVALAVPMLWQARLEEAEPWLERAEASSRDEVYPAVAMLLHYARGLHELARGRHHEALSAFCAGAALGERLVAHHPLTARTRSLHTQTLVRLGDTRRAEQALAAAESTQHDATAMCQASAVLRLAQGDAEGAVAALAPVLDGTSVGPNLQVWQVQTFLLEAMAREALGEHDAGTAALETALNLAEPDRLILPFLLHPAPELLECHRRERTSHPSLISEILDLLAGTSREPESLRAPSMPEPLSDAELRVLRYLPSHLKTGEIASELFVSPNTVKVHLRHIYGKLDVNSRREAVERARTLRLLAPSARAR